jgi:uncharacterized protein with ParB-like and HNH nuclease domain
MSFTPVTASVLDILNAPTQYVIPVYQRDYKWGKDEARELIEDFSSYAEAEGGLFLGSMIFERSGGKTLIVDGQQRLTTILLLLVACRRRADALRHQKLGQEILRQITFVDPATAQSKGVRLAASESVRDVFEYITDSSWDGAFPTVIDKKPVRRQVNRVKPIYCYFWDEVSKLDQAKLEGFLRAVYSAFAIKIEIQDEVAALSIFERTNARGMELEISDLLKTYLFDKNVAGIKELWSEVVENSGGTILRMLKYFYIAQKEHVLKPKLYIQLKQYATQVGAEKLTSELVKFSRFYKTARSQSVDEKAVGEYFETKGLKEVSTHQPMRERIAFSLQALREFGVTQFCPPAYAAIEGAAEAGRPKPAAAKALVRLFEAFEKYHFINNAVCDRVGNEVEMLYADSCSELRRAADISVAVDKFIAKLAAKLAPEDEFVARFCDLSYSSGALSLLFYIFDRFNNFGREPGQWLRIYDPDPKVARRHNSIEHFHPQRPGPDLAVEDATREWANNIGNLLPIHYKVNSSLGNSSPAKKIELLKGKLSKNIENYSYVKDFIGRYGDAAATWDGSSIQKRAEDMAREGYDKVWKIK